MRRLDEYYSMVYKLINKIDFNSLWKGFKPLKFALYNEVECFFDGEYIEMTDAFIGNTAIKYNGEIIAIWNLIEEIDLELLCSKIVHEMFHGFQMLNNESRFPDEMEALYKYKYLNENLSAKFLENELLVELLNEFSYERYKELLKIKRFRFEKFNYEFLYEAKIEVIEGIANYIELNVLKQISYEKYRMKLVEMINDVKEVNNLMPARIICYNTGALFLKLLIDNNISFNHEFNDKTIVEDLINNVDYSIFIPKISLENPINNYFENAAKIIDNALLKNDLILDSVADLLGVNFYNAVYYKDYIISKYFVMYGDVKYPIVKYGDFVIKTDSYKKINKIYKL